MPGGLGGSTTRAKTLKTVANPGYDPGKTYTTGSGTQATLNPRQLTGYNPNYNPMGSSQTLGGGGGGGGGMPGMPGGGWSPWGGGGGAPGGQFSGGGAGGAGGAGGGTTGGRSELQLTAERSPDIDNMIAAWDQRMAELRQKQASVDENLQFQIEQYKSRLGEGPTTRAIERSASAIRDQLAGQTAQAEQAAAQAGRGQGFGQSGLAESAQRAQAGAAAGIALGRERDLDQLTIAGQNIMQAPGQREMGYNQLLNQQYAQAPHFLQAQQGLGEKQLGLQAYLGQGDLGLRELEAQSRMYGTPWDWMRFMG